MAEVVVVVLKLVLKSVLDLLVVLAALLLGAGQLGLMAGQAPADLGVAEGRLKPPSNTDNSVSSQAMLYPDNPASAAAQIAPLPLRGDGAATLARIATLVAATPGARVLQHRPDYLYAQYQSRWMHFVDDVEFWVDPAAGVLQLRSASRVGRRDFGANRQRIEALRAALAAQP